MSPRRMRVLKDPGKVFLLRAIMNIQENHMMDASAFNRRIAKGEPPWRDIAITSSGSLYQLAEVIINAFNFDFDHCFGFFSPDFKHPFYHDAKRKYELFTDIPDVEPTGAGSVEKTPISAVWKKPGDIMIMLFDYGDEWWFRVTLQAIQEPKKYKRYPNVVQKEGKAPQQYGY